MKGTSKDRQFLATAARKSHEIFICNFYLLVYKLRSETELNVRFTGNNGCGDRMQLRLAMAPRAAQLAMCSREGSPRRGGPSWRPRSGGPTVFSTAAPSPACRWPCLCARRWSRRSTRTPAPARHARPAHHIRHIRHTFAGCKVEVARVCRLDNRKIQQHRAYTRNRCSMCTSAE